jgi:bifunctional non-homologous end joining protein LigD
MKSVADLGTADGKHPRTLRSANLSPRPHDGEWGYGLTAEKIADCRWLRPVLAAEFEFVEWTSDGHLRHAAFVASSDAREARDVCRNS